MVDTTMIDENVDGSGDGHHYSIRFYSADKRLEGLPNDELSVPAEIQPNELTQLVNLSAQTVNEDWKERSLSFLLHGLIICTPLSEFVQENKLGTESVLEIECIIQEPAPIPDQNIVDEDWVSSVLVTSKLIYSTNYGGSLNIWSHAGKKLNSHPFKEESLRCLDTFKMGEDQFVVCGGEGQTLTVFKTGPSFDLVPIALLRGHERSVECVVASKSKGSLIVSGGFDKCLKIWKLESDDTTFQAEEDDVESKKRKTTFVTKVPLTTLQSHRDAVMDVAWHPLNKNQAITASWDQSIILWDIELGGMVSSMSSNKAHSRLSINSTSAMILTASMDSVIRLWDFRSKEDSMVKQGFRGHTSIVSGVNWSPTDERLFVSSSFDGTVKMWDIRSPDAPLYDITGHVGHVLTVDWSYDSLIASAGKDSTIKTYKR